MLHADTELLTRRRGWVRVADLTIEDDVASALPRENRQATPLRERDALGRFPPAVNEKDSAWWQANAQKIAIPSVEIVWMKPTRLISEQATDGLLHFRNDSVDLRVTPDHLMLTYGTTKSIKVVEAQFFGNQRGWFNAGLWRDGTVVVDERLLRLAVAAQADGNYIVNGVTQPKIRFGFSKQRKIDRLASLLQEGEYKRGVSSNGKYQPTTYFTLDETTSSEVKKLLDPDKTLPWWWIELTTSLRNVAIEEVEFWDSHRATAMRCYHFSTAIKKNAEVLQAISVITNRKATYVERQPVDPPAPGYKLSVKRKYDTRGDNVKRSIAQCTDVVWSVAVESGYVLVRDSGIPIIVASARILEVTR